MSKRGIPRGLATVAALVVSAVVWAHEPDGRVAIRYDWPDVHAGDTGPPKLRLTLTAVVDLKELRLTAKVPGNVGLGLSGANRVARPWPDEGVELGDLPAGKVIVVELDVAKPAHGGGIVGFVLHGRANDVPVLEGVGVPVGVPGVEPTLRNGALEFPAAQGDPAP